MSTLGLVFFTPSPYIGVMTLLSSDLVLVRQRLGGRDGRMTQAEAAEAAQVNASTWKQWETRGPGPHTGHVVQLMLIQMQILRPGSDFGRWIERLRKRRPH